MFIYLCSIVPAIWILELKTNRREMLCLYIELVQLNFKDEEEDALAGEENTGQRFKSKMLLDLMQV